MVDSLGGKRTTIPFFDSSDKLGKKSNCTARISRLLGVLVDCFGQVLTKCPDCPQCKHSPRFMHHCHSTGLSLPSAPNMLLIGLLGVVA